MAISVQKKSKRKKHIISKFFSLIIICCVITGAVILSVRLIGGGGGIRQVSLDAVQEKLEELGWVEQDLLPVNDYSRPGTKLGKINAIVIHYVGNPGTTAKQNRSYYGKLADTHETSASSNFLIGMDGEILECVPVNEVAYCSNQRNDDTISLECCHPDETGKFTDGTYASLVKLTAWLCNELGLDSSDLLRHYDITKKECPKYYVDHAEAWESFKQDVQAALDETQTSMNT